MNPRLTLDDYLALDYPFQAFAEPDGGYTIIFPDLPGCLSVAEDLDSVSAMALEAKQLWLEVTYEQGLEIPLPSYPETYSGKFNLRLPKSLHRRLAEDAARDEVSLNQHVVGLLAERMGSGSIQVELRAMAEAQEAMRAELARMAACIEEIQTTVETYKVEAPKKAQHNRRAGEAAQPGNVYYIGAVAA